MDVLASLTQEYNTLDGRSRTVGWLQARTWPSAPDGTDIFQLSLEDGRKLEAEAMLHGPIGLCPNCDPRVKHTGGDPPREPCEKPVHIACAYGTVIKDRQGYTVRSPWVAIRNQAMAPMTRLLGEFGMTPASRTRIPGVQVAEKNSRRAPGANQQPETAADPRDILKSVFQAAKN